MANAAAAPVLELSGIHKAFPGVKALSEAGLRLYPGEVHTLMGQNGAGKSTLIKVLTGVHAPDQGRIALEGRAIHPRSTLEAQELGISTVYQEVNLCPNLSVAENIFIGRYPRRWGMVDWAAMRTRAAALLRDLEIDIDVSAPLSHYPLAIQQMVAISRALNISSRVLVLDEPTSSLDEAEVQLLFRVLRRLREQGMAILFVTHFLDQTYAISDRITVMRNGEREGEYAAADLSRLALVNKMIGKAADAADAAEGSDTAVQRNDGAHGAAASRVVLETRGLGRKGVLQPMDLQVREGEVLGLAGLLGAGRTELARLLFGADRADKGDIAIGDKAYGTFANPRQAIAAGIGFCSEDRKLEGAVLSLSVRENLVLALQARQGMLRAIPLHRQRELAEEYVKALGIRTASIETPIGTLSGGNQQKVLLARWLATDPRLMILDEPTRGIDVRAKQEIMDYVTTLCKRGMSLLFISSELPEVLRVSDRMIVMRDRASCGEYRRGELDETTVLHAIAGEAA
ncbi:MULTISPECIES: sugar ABC transporter ATP-binding protein [unclassified Duganella]|uniref:sugar ABC transporter ATP-binding protein n=1 Tax=unclassified Duganella TaxID=2636909 RepID=UPI0006F79B4C|nr:MULTISPECIES: sugar ABC transporter ATP-binding protein [unclassified Duganella]KQV45261.1 sugar ABC transporter ATP-binding protein [Duganella sp. Root336D2]KRC02820.1 sugar ABC transporter ATP-binding protein [Duganella sp. Root198D2]